MLDPNDKKSTIKEMNITSPERASSEETQSSEIKRCLDCGTSKTPLWRGGPAGPKSLCNACGIRSRKKRRAILGIKSEEKKPKKTSSNNNSPTNSSSTTSSTITNNSKMGSPLHQRLLAIGRKVMMQRSTVDRLGEEEQAAVLLMALSYGSVYA